VESEQVAHDSVEALEQAIARVGAERIAAFFLEPVIGAGGLYPPGHRYIEGVAAICARNDVLLVADAVICGFGRLGTWFGIERWDVAPDMITFVKGVTSGYLPLGGVIIADRIAEPFWNGPGSPVFRQGATDAGHATCARRRWRTSSCSSARTSCPAGARWSRCCSTFCAGSPITRRRARCAAVSERWPRSSSTASCSHAARPHSVA